MINFLFATVLREFLFLVVLPFIVWMISWWGFITGKVTLGSDAFLYYWDSRFFLENISRGVYPLWNPYYSGGVPWNFFLRRIGEVNPFYWIITGFKFLGFSALQAHLFFVVTYFFIGLIGFWLLARLFLKDRLTSTGAYLLLLFSWGGQLFYCFDVLMFVPLVWFFYFLFAFGREKKKHQFLGVSFTLSLMITTYIPFFTLTIIGFFLFFFILFFMKESIDFFKAKINFIYTHKFIAGISLAFFLLACVPVVSFYLESKGGGFVLPTRHLGATNSSQVAIGTKVNNSSSGIDVSRTVWDIIANGYFDRVFSDQKNVNVGDFNIAYPFFIVMLLAIINPASRRIALLLVSGVFLTLSALTKGSLYPFLLTHLFFFRYMRMLHLFFWLAIVPIAVLMAMEQLRVFLRDHYGKRNLKVLGFVVFVHILFIGGLCTQEGIVWSSYLAVLLSMVFFILAILGRWSREALAILWWFCLMVQPLEITRYINKNSQAAESSYNSDHSTRYVGEFSLLKRMSPDQIQGQAHSQETGTLDSSGYYENPWFLNVRQAIFKNIISGFTANRLLLSDNTAPEDDFSNSELFSKISKMWKTKQNLVLLPLENAVPEDFQSLDTRELKSRVVYEDDPAVKVLSFDANTLKLQTHLARPQFLLWTDGYHVGWHVYIDGHEGRLLRADYAFKGAWIPSGEHVVIFRFGTLLHYALAYILLLAYAMILLLVVGLGVKEGFLLEDEVALGI